MSVKVADKFVAMGDFELLDAQDVLVDIDGTPKRLQEAIDNRELGGDIPVGHILSYMGITAPKHYLSCDGTIYNISEYPELANHFEREFGSSNFFGGDGTTTFAVPDLRGEFLRGTGTATRDTGTGASVGLHQDATESIEFGINTNDNSIWFDTSTTMPPNANQIRNGNFDRILKLTNGSTNSGYYADLKKWNGSTNYSHYTARPTNTSVLYCIKCEHTYFMKNAYSADSVYSTDEIAIGKWIDGKTIYRKIVNFGQLPNSGNMFVPHGISDFNEITNLIAIGYEANSNTWMTLPCGGNPTVTLYIRGSDIGIFATGNLSAYLKTYVTIEYTKK